MARRLLRKYLPDPHRLAQERGLRPFKRILHQPNLWHLNRRSVARGFAVGFFWTCVPMPFQMVPATACAIWLRANLAITVLLTWLSNPLTWGLQVYGAYRLGRWILQQPPPAEFDGSAQWLVDHLSQAWLPLLTGTAAAAAVLTAGSYLVARLFWRWHVAWAWRRRAARRISSGADSGRRSESAPPTISP